MGLMGHLKINLWAEYLRDLYQSRSLVGGLQIWGCSLFNGEKGKSNGLARFFRFRRFGYDPNVVGID